MQEAIALLAPSLIALKFYNHLHSNKLNSKSLMMSYGVFVVGINLLLYSIALYIVEVGSVVFTDTFFIKYLISATTLALILPFAVRLLESTISIRVNNRNDTEK